MRTDIGKALEDPATIVRVVEFNWDDMGPSPSRWANRGIPAPLSMAFWWTYILLPERRPILFIRTYIDGKAVAVLREVGATIWDKPKDEPLEIYVGPAPILPVAGDPEGKCDDIITWEASNSSGSTLSTLLDGIHKATGASRTELLDLLGLPMSAGEPKSIYRASSRGARTIEGDIFDASWEYMPYAVCIDPPGAAGPYFTWASTLKGTFQGHPLAQTAGCDRMYGDGAIDYITTVPTHALVGSAISDNGVREMVVAYVLGDKRSFAMYWKDGQEPVVSEEVEMQARYVANPDNPNMIAPAEATFRFGGVEISWTSQYLATSVGVINHFGVWRERNSPMHAKYLGALECKILPGSVAVSEA